MIRPMIVLAACVLSACASTEAQKQPAPGADGADAADSLELGHFSVSLAVKDLGASRVFYEKLGFREVGGDGVGWLILQNDTATIGLFQGMFEKNILTFNPGWDRNSNTLPEFDDVREIQRLLRARGIEPVLAADESTSGPASLIVVDPDGNQILVDQHVSRTGR